MVPGAGIEPALCFQNRTANWAARSPKLQLSAVRIYGRGTLDAVNRMMMDMVAAIARKDYDQHRAPTAWSFWP